MLPYKEESASYMVVEEWVLVAHVSRLQPCLSTEARVSGTPGNVLQRQTPDNQVLEAPVVKPIRRGAKRRALSGSVMHVFTPLHPTMGHHYDLVHPL